MAQRPVTTLQGLTDQLQSQLQSIAVADRDVEAKRRLFAWLTWIFGILGFVALCTGILFFITLMLWPVAIVTGILWNKYRAVDLDNDRLQLAASLVQTLKPDISQKSPALLSIQHGDWFDNGVQSGDPISREDRWLSFKSRMTDGSICRLAVAVGGKRKKKAKRKYTKIKERFRDKVTLTLRLPADRYPHLERLEGSLQPGRLQSRTGLMITGVQVRPPQVRVTAISDLQGRFVGRSGQTRTGDQHKVDARKLVELLAFIYGGLSHCRGEESRPVK